MHVILNNIKPVKPTNYNKRFKIIRFVGEVQLRNVFQNKKAFGLWFRKGLQDMGPAFIKFGQFLSTRQDIFDKDVIKELTTLQDDNTPVLYNEIYDVIKKSNMEDVFEYIDNKPYATASIGQVHKARLKTKEDIVIKVQKPKVADSIRNDLKEIKFLLDLFKYVNPTQASETTKIIEQYEKYLTAELDYSQELDHMKRFKKIFQGMDIKVPDVYDMYSSTNMLVMEYVPSIKISNIELLDRRGYNRSRIATSLTQAFIYQMMNKGFIHCDPHPGNIGVSDDGYTIVLYDFGNVVQLSKKFRASIGKILFAIFQKDVHEFVDLLVDLEVLTSITEYQKYELKQFFASFFNYLENQDFSTLKETILNGDMQTGLESKLKINPDFLSLFRIFTLLDGTCSLLDPQFNYIETIQPFTEDIFSDKKFIQYRMERDMNKMRIISTTLQATDGNMIKMQKKLTNISKDLQSTQNLALGYLLVIMMMMIEKML